MGDQEVGRASPFSVNDPDIKQLLEHNNTLSDLGSVSALLSWDQAVYMPGGAGEARSLQLATVSVIAHEKATNPKAGELLSKLYSRMCGGSCDFSYADTRLIRESMREYARAVKIPSTLVEELAVAASTGVECWKEAKKQSDFGLFKNSLRGLVELQVERASCLDSNTPPYDTLMDEYERGLTAAEAEKFFEPLKRELPGIVAATQNAGDSDLYDSFLRQRVKRDLLERFSCEVLAAMGFGFNTGRFDVSAHPFTTSFHPTDVRITSRYNEPSFMSSFFGAVHEGGHALYEQGIDLGLARTVLGTGVSMGIHESQSRLWENMIGRSTPFWTSWYPKLWADLLNGGHHVISEDRFVKAINMVKPGFIRVDADEVTYNLHILVRFELEKALISGDLSVDDVPSAWNEKMRQYLGTAPEKDSDGCLQDIHWSCGNFGYFPTYTLGNLNAAQLMATIRKEFSDFDERIVLGDTLFLREWLREKIHKHGCLYSPKELMMRVTGEELNPGYFLNYIKDKVSGLFGVSL